MSVTGEEMIEATQSALGLDAKAAILLLFGIDTGPIFLLCFFESFLIIITEFLEFAGVTFWTTRRTVIATKEDKWVVHSYALLEGETFYNSLICCLRRGSSNESYSVTNTMNMCIYTDIRRII